MSYKWDNADELEVVTWGGWMGGMGGWGWDEMGRGNLLGGCGVVIQDPDMEVGNV